MTTRSWVMLVPDDDGDDERFRVMAIMMMPSVMATVQVTRTMVTPQNYSNDGHPATGVLR